MPGCGHWLRGTARTLMLGLAVVGCGSQVDTAEHLTIPGRFPNEDVTEPLIALEAFFDETQFYIRYQGAEGIVYSGGNWANRIPLEAIEAGKADRGPYLLPLEYRQLEPWESRPAESITGEILSPQDWRDFREQLFASSLSKVERSGLALHFFVEDYFLYYDAAAVFQSSRLVDKPANYSVKESISFTEFLQRGLQLLEAFLEEKNIAERRILFNTGDTGAYSLPFLYVNLDLPIVVFARYEPKAASKQTAGPAVPYIQTAGHLAHSHLGSLVTRPVSSLYRLFFVATDTVRETATPHWLINLEATEIPPVNDGPGMNLGAWEKYLERTTGRESSRGTIEYLVDGEEFFTRLIDAMTSASQSIHLRTYIFDNDDFAEKIAKLLKRRSNKNIDVKMLFDGLGTIFATIEKQDSLPEDWEGAASVRRFLEADSEVDVRQASNPWFTGDHVKTIIIDHQVAFTGGMNIAREYRYDWHDLMMEVHGPVVDILEEEFHKAWAHAGFFGDYGYFMQRIAPRLRTTRRTLVIRCASCLRASTIRRYSRHSGPRYGVRNATSMSKTLTSRMT